MKKLLTKVSVFSLITLSFFLNPLSVTVVEADYLKVTAPAEIALDKQFEVEVEISAKPNSTYAAKIRLGPAQNQLTKGQTLDANSSIWLSDSVSWDRFPTFQTDADGHWTGKLMAKAGSTASIGQNLLFVRIKNMADNQTKDSEPYQISINEPIKSPPSPKVEEKGEPILNEFLATPNGGQEWVEIKNKGAGKMDLSDWQIDDEAGKSSPFIIPAGTIVESNSFYVANFTSPKLNDSSDSVRLLKPDGTLVEEYRYSSPEKGKSFAKDTNGNWFITENITPGTTNPNPPAAVGSPTANKPSTNKVLAETTQAEDSVEPRLPKLSSSNSTKLATVSASYKNNDEDGGLVSKLPFIVGGLLILSALGIFGRKIYAYYQIRQVQELPEN